MKKLTSLVLSVVIVLSMLPINVITAFADNEPMENVEETEYKVDLEAEADISWKRTREYNWWGTPQSLIFNRKGDLLRWKWSDANTSLNDFRGTVWDNGYNAGVTQSRNSSFATWKNAEDSWGNDLASLRRFKGSFQIPEGFSAKDTVMLSSVNQASYSGFNDGNIVPINDNIYIFVYKQSDANKINNANFMEYLAFWTGTSNQNGIVSFNGVPGTQAHHYKSGNLPSYHPLYHVDGWYCNATLDNIGNSIFKNYEDAVSGDKFIIDVFAADYNNTGGMDELEITFKKATDRRAVVNYYKEEINEGNLLGTYVMKNLYQGQEIKLKQGKKEGELNYYKHELPANVYHNGEQRPEVAFVGQEEETVINVVYPLKRDQTYKTEHYFENTDGETYRIVEESGTGKLGSTVVAKEMENLPYHTFDKDNENNVLEGTVDKGKLVLKVYYDRNEYKLSYNANLDEGESLNSGDVPSTQSYLAENEAGVAGSNSMNRRGYSFKGWNTVKDGTGDNFSQGAKIEILKDTELFAKWEKDTNQWFSVKYDANTGTGTKPEDTNSYLIGTQVKVLGKESLAKEYYTFNGWNTAKDGTGKPYKENDLTIGLTGNVTLFAQWKENDKFAVSYDVNGGTGEVPEGEQLYAGVTYTVKDSSITKIGYKFNGWIYIDSQGAKVLKPGDSFIMPSKEVNLEAFWVRDESQKHTVSYEKDGGIGNAPNSKDMYHGDIFEVQNGDITKAGYKLDGWKSNVAIDGKTGFAVGEEFTMPNRDIVLTAKWVRDEAQNHTVSYENDGGIGEVPQSEQLYAGDTHKVEASSITKVGYKLDGWKSNIAINGKTGFAVGEEFTMPNRDVVLTANWVRDEAQNHTITYNPSQGEGTMPNQTKRYAGEDYTVEDVSITRFGYEFIGWECNIDGTSKTLNANDKFTMPNEDVTLVAKWQKDTINWHSVTYEENGGLGDVPIDETSYVTGSNVVVKDKAGLQLENHLFAGWNTKANGDGTSYSANDEIKSIGNSITLFAQWEKDPEKWSTLNYDMQGGIADIDSEEHYVGDKFSLTGTVPTKENYVFAGWKLEGTNEVYPSGGSFTMGETDVAMLAQWDKDPLKWHGVTYDANGANEKEPEDEKTYLEGTSVTVSDATLTKPGYNFGGWKLGDTVYQSGSTFDMLGDDVTLVADWVYDEDQWHTVTYDTNGATQDNFEDSDKYYVEKEVIVTDKTITKPGYSFDGWQLDNDVLKAGETFRMPNDDVTLTALWSRDDDQWHTISYDANDAIEEAPTDNGEYHVDQEVTVSSDVMSKDGYKFLGWLYDGEHYGSVGGNKDTLIMPNENATLVADFEKINGMWFKVTYNANLPEDTELAGGSVPVDQTEYMSTDTVAVKTNENGMSVVGYTFKGWMLQPDASELVAETILVTDHTPLYAKWEKTEGEWFKVTYDANGGEYTPNGGEYLVDTEVLIASASEMERRGFTFGGWVSEQINNGEVITEESFKMPNQPVELKAQWDEIVAAISITHKYFTNNKFDGEITDENTEIGYEFSIINLIKDLFSSLKYTANLDKVVVERRLIAKEAQIVEEVPVVPEEVPETPPNGGGTSEVPNTDGEGIEQPTEPLDPTTPDGGNGKEEKPTEPTTPDGGNGTEEKPTEPTTPDGGNGTEEKPTEPTTPDGGEGTEEKPAEPTTPDGDNGTAEKPVDANTPDGGNETEEKPVDPNTLDADKGTEENPTEPTTPDVDGNHSKTSDLSTTEDKSFDTTESASDSSSDSSNSSKESARDTSVLAATSEDDVETILALESEIKQAEEEHKEEVKIEESLEEPKSEVASEDEQNDEETNLEATNEEDVETRAKVSEVEEESTEAEWEVVEAVDGKYIFEEGYEYRTTINYYRTVSHGGGGGGGRDRDDDDDDRNDKPTVTIPDQDVPLAKPGQITIVDEQVPLGKLPQTGGNSLAIAGSTGLLAIVLAAVRKLIGKKEDE